MSHSGFLLLPAKTPAEKNSLKKYCTVSLFKTDHKEGCFLLSTNKVLKCFGLDFVRHVAHSKDSK